MAGPPLFKLDHLWKDDGATLRKEGEESPEAAGAEGGEADDEQGLEQDNAGDGAETLSGAEASEMARPRLPDSPAPTTGSPRRFKMRGSKANSPHRSPINPERTRTLAGIKRQRQREEEAGEQVLDFSQAHLEESTKHSPSHRQSGSGSKTDEGPTSPESSDTGSSDALRGGKMLLGKSHKSGSKLVKKQKSRIDPSSGNAQKAAPCVVKLRIFLRRHSGSCLVAWVRYFDRDNSQRIKCADFTWVLQQLKFQGDPKEIFSTLDVDESGELSLEEVEPEEAAIWNRFRIWCVQTFSSVEDFLWRLGGRKTLESKRLECDAFMEGVQQLGYQPAVEDSEKMIFEALAIGTVEDDHTAVRAEDLTWFRVELDRHKKKEQAKKNALERMLKKGSLQDQGLTKSVALSKFKEFLMQQFGGYFRAWRAVFGGVGQHAVYFLRQRQFFKACCELGWTRDLRLVWKALGKSDHSWVRVDEICPSTAAILAKFQRLLQERYGGAMKAYHRLSKDGLNRVSRRVIAELVADDEYLCQHTKVLCTELRQARAKRLSKEDFVFLDVWKPLEYLLSAPNPSAADELKACLLRVHKNYLKAWRSVLDVDGSNYVTWEEFEHAARCVGFEGDIGGAWVHLDTDLSGNITLEEIDPVSNSILVDFKRWADTEFGSVKSAFILFDTDRSGSLSVREWRQACRIYGYNGCPRLLFFALDVDGGGFLSMAETSFLDGWPSEANAAALAAALREYQFAGENTSEYQLGLEDSETEGDTNRDPNMSLLPAPVLKDLERAAMKAIDVLGPKALPSVLVQKVTRKSKKPGLKPPVPHRSRRRRRSSAGEVPRPGRGLHSKGAHRFAAQIPEEAEPVQDEGPLFVQNIAAGLKDRFRRAIDFAV